MVIFNDLKINKLYVNIKKHGKKMLLYFQSEKVTIYH